MKYKVSSLILVLFIIFSSFLVGCSKPITNQPADNIIKIGWIGSLSGDLSIWGECELNTVKMIFEEINTKDHGVLGKKLEVIGYDTKGDPQEAVNAVKRLTTVDKVVAIIGPNASSSAIPISAVLEQVKVADIATVATNPNVTIKNGKVKPYNFRVCYIDPYQGAVAAAFSLEVLKSKNAAILYDTSDEYSKSLTQYFDDYFSKNGGTIVAKEGFKSGDFDFKSQLIKIKDAKPDIIFMPYYFNEVSLSATQAKKLGITATLMGADGWPSEELVSSSKEAVEGAYFVNHLNYDDPDVQDFRALYKDKYKIEPEINAYLAYDAIMMLVDAIKRAGEANPEKIAKALETTDIKGITGRIKIGLETHNPEGKEAAIIKIVNGKYIFQQKFSAK